MADSREMMSDDRNVAEKTYRAIGRFIFEFSQLEYTIRHYLATEIKLNGTYFFAVVGSYDVAHLCNVAAEVFSKSRSSENADQIKKLLGKVKGFNDERNRVAHGLWIPFKEGGTVNHTTRTKLKPEQFSDQAEKLETSATEIHHLNVRLAQALLGVSLSE